MALDIPQDKRELAKKTYGVDDADINMRIEREIEALKQIYKEKWETLKPEQQQMMVANRVLISYKTYNTGVNAKTFVVIVHGIGKRMDMTARRIKAAKDLYLKDRAKAIREGYTDKDGNALDARRYWDEAKTEENPNFGKILPVHDWERHIYGLAQLLDDYEAGKDPIPFIMRLKKKLVKGENGEVTEIDMSQILPEKFKKYTIQAFGETTDDKGQPLDELHLGALAGNPDKPDQPKTEFKNPEPLGDGIEYDDDILQKYMGEEFVEQIELPKWHDENSDDKGNLAFDAYCIVRGTVGNISPDISAKGNRVMYLEPDSLDKPLMVLIPDDHCKVNFPVGVPVTIIASTYRKEDRDGSLVICLNALGIYVQNNFRTEEASYTIGEGTITVDKETESEDDEEEEQEIKVEKKPAKAKRNW